MIYILIVLWVAASTDSAGKAALAVEFDDLVSCQAAANEIRRQASDSSYRKIGTILCAQKGTKK